MLRKDFIMSTIRQVAEKAGVSIATVSRILSADKSFQVRQETIDRVYKVVEELDYVYKPKPRTRYAVGCIIGNKPDSVSKSNFDGVLAAIENESSRRKIALTIINPYTLLEDSEQFQAFSEKEFNNIIVIGTISQEVMSKLSDSFSDIIEINYHI